MTNPTPHGQVPEALIDLIDAYAETRHRCGGIYNAKTEAARKAVIEALSGVQALSAAPQPVAQRGAADGFFLLLPQRPKPEAPAGTAGLDWDAYSGAQMLAFGRDCSDAAIAALRAQQPAPAAGAVAHTLSDAQIEAMPVWRNFVGLWPESRREIVDAVVDLLTTPPTQAADSVLEDAARESEYRRGYRHGYEQRDAEVRGALA